MKLPFIILILFCPLLTMCQPVTITGKVITEEGIPIPGAAIQVKPSGKTTISDINGLFFLSLLKDRHPERREVPDTLIISASGYDPEIIIISQIPRPESGFNVILKHTVRSLGEVIITTGYTALPRERSTGSFEKINKEALSRRVSPDWLSRLEGISGIYFDKRGTAAGAVMIRGRSTIFANASPLIVVDNFPYDGDINNINPEDIENITILKDAAAASIWGVRAGNGVIVITTKKGKQSEIPSLEFTTAVTTGAKPDLFYSQDAMTSSDFIDVELLLFSKGFYNSAINNTTSRPPLSPIVEMLVKRRTGLLSAADSAMQVDALRNIDTRNDLDRFFYRRSSAQQYALNYSGGTRNSSYFFSAGYDKILSALVRNNNDRVTLRSHTSYTPFSALELNMDMAYARSAFENNNAGSITSGGGKNLYPYAQLADTYGNPLPLVKDYRFAFIDTAGAGKLLDWKYRPLQDLYAADNTALQVDLRFNITASWKLNKHFTADVLYQYEKQTTDKKNLYSQDTYFTRNLINRFYNPAASGKYAVPLGSVLDLSQSVLVSQNARTQVNYRQSWNAVHEVNALAGAEIRQSQASSYAYRTYGYNDDILTYNNVNYKDNLPVYASLSSPQPVPNPAFFSAGVLRFVSLYANAAYTYSKRYTLTVSARKDASNLFGVSSNQKWVPLWSSGLGWQINNEKFYKSKWFPYLRLRLTYGYNGNVDNTLSAFTTIRYSTGALFTSQQYATVQNPPNPELRWEKMAVGNIGIDFGLKSNRVSGSIDAYWKTGKDLVGFAPVDPTTGVLNNLLQFSFKGNVADMKGKGIELALNSENLTGVFKWSTSLLFNYVSSKVTKYNLTNLNAGAFLNYGTAVNPVPGRPLYSIYSYPWAGLDPATGDPRGYLNGTVSKDYTSLVNVTVDKLIYHGSAIPVTFGSLLNTFAWKKFSLSANIIYKLGYYFRRTSLNYNSLFNNWIGHADYTNRWQKPGDEKFTNVPSLIYPNSNTNRDNFYTSSAALVEKGDHIRLQDISFSYSIGHHKNKWPVKDIRVYTYINNIGILWKANKAGLDPDYFSGGFPLPLTVSFGVKAVL